MPLKKNIAFVCFFYAINLNAQTCCSGGVPLSNSIGMPLSEKGVLQIGLNYDYNNLNTLNNGSETLDDDSRLRITHSILLNTNYSITKNLSAEGLFTWINQRRRITQFGNQTLNQSSGIGDAVFLLKYNFIGKQSNLGIGLGTKIPLGSSTEVDSRNILLINDLQPGSNAWDIIYWLSGSINLNIRPSFSIFTRLTYRNTGTDHEYLGNSTYKYGNEFQGFLNFSDQFILLKTIINPGLSFKYRNTVKDETGGGALDNTGGNWVFLIPSFSINVSPNIAFSTRAELPLYSNVDGTQLTPTYRLTSGFILKIKPKPKLHNLPNLN